MDKQRQDTRVKNGIKILFWFGFLAFFAYSFQAIMDFEGLANPRRQEAFIRILTALSKPNFFEGETNRQIAVQMWETILIGFLSTTLSAVFAIPLTFLSARPSASWRRGSIFFYSPFSL